MHLNCAFNKLFFKPVFSCLQALNSLAASLLQAIKPVTCERLYGQFINAWMNSTNYICVIRKHGCKYVMRPSSMEINKFP